MITYVASTQHCGRGLTVVAVWARTNWELAYRKTENMSAINRIAIPELRHAKVRSASRRTVELARRA
jgi:hypothetical protein